MDVWSCVKSCSSVWVFRHWSGSGIAVVVVVAVVVAVAVVVVGGCCVLLDDFNDHHLYPLIARLS